MYLSRNAGGTGACDPLETFTTVLPREPPKKPGTIRTRAHD